MQVFLVVSCNFCLSLLLLGLASFFWQWQRYLVVTNVELDTTIQETQIALKQATLRCQEQQLTLLQARSQYHRLQRYLKQLQQLGQLLSFLGWLRGKIAVNR